MLLQKFLRAWPFERGRDRFYRMLPESFLEKLDALPDPIVMKSGTRLFSRKGDYLSRWFKCYGEYEQATDELLTESAQEGEVFLDVGTSIGLFSINLARLVGCNVVSFEPNPTTAECLRKGVALNGVEDKIRVFEVAVSNEEGTAHFVDHPTNSGSSSLESGEPGNQAGDRYEVQVVQLDTFGPFIEHIGSLDQPIGVIKMDVEGAEEFAIEGMAGLLQKHSPVLIVELVEDQLLAFGSSKAKLIDRLKTIGYHLEREFDGNGVFRKSVSRV